MRLLNLRYHRENLLLSYLPLLVLPQVPPTLSWTGVQRMTVTTYNTWDQFVRAADNTTSLNPHHNTSRRKSDPTWSGTATWQETMDLALRGWPEGLRKVKDQVSILERFVSPRQPHKELTHAVRGPGILDFSHYQQGRPDSWVVWEDVDTQDGQSAIIVPLVFNLSASSGVSPETMFRRGATICALIDILEHSRIRVEVLAVEHASYGSYGQDTYTFRVMLKKAQDHLDMDRMAFALCNASVLRRLMFSLAEQYVPNLPSSYGHPATWTEAGAINIDSASLHIREERDMLPWLVSQLAGYGVEVDK